MQTAFQADIIKRMYDAKDLKAFIEQYNNTRYSSGKMEKPTEKQYRLASLAKEVGYTNAARKVGVDVELVYRAVNRVARWEYLKG